MINMVISCKKKYFPPFCQKRYGMRFPVQELCNIADLIKFLEVEEISQVTRKEDSIIFDKVIIERRDTIIISKDS